MKLQSDACHPPALQGCKVRIKIPDVDRWKCDPQSIIAIVLEKTTEKFYHLGSFIAVVKNYYDIFLTTLNIFRNYWILAYSSNFKRGYSSVYVQKSLLSSAITQKKIFVYVKHLNPSHLTMVKDFLNVLANKSAQQNVAFVIKKLHILKF